MSDAWQERGEWLGRVLQLEGERLRLMLLVALGLEPSGALGELDRQLDAALAALSRRGVRYPGHFLAEQYALSGGEYLVLTAALLPHHRPDVLTELSARANMEWTHPRLSMIARAALPADVPLDAFATDLRASTLCQEGLVTLSDDGDPLLQVHRAVLDLFGLD